MKMSVPSYWCRAAIKASIDPISRWVVGSSIRRRLGGSRRSLTRARRDFSPPLRTPTVLKTSSPRKKGTENGSGGLLAYWVRGVEYRFENLVFHIERIAPVLGEVSDPDIVTEESFAALNGEGSAEEF